MSITAICASRVRLRMGSIAVQLHLNIALRTMLRHRRLAVAGNPAFLAQQHRLPGPCTHPTTLCIRAQLSTHYSTSGPCTPRISSTSCSASKAAGASSSSSSSNDEGIRFVYEQARKRLRLKRPSRHGKPTDVAPRVDVMLDGRLEGWDDKELEDLAGEVGVEAGQVMRQALLNKAKAEPKYKLPRTATLSLVLCDDPHIRALNFQHRNKDAPTDVLSFEMGDELAYKVHLPVMLLGDVVVSLDTAQRQASERNHSLRDELRILLVHGILHLCGFDHELGDAQTEAMATAEASIMSALGWKGQGLIEAQGQLDEGEEGRAGGKGQQGVSGQAATGPEGKAVKLDRTAVSGAGKGASGAGKGASGVAPGGAAGAQVGLGSIWQAAGLGGAGAGAGAGSNNSNVIRRAAVAAAAKGGPVKAEAGGNKSIPAVGAAGSSGHTAANLTAATAAAAPAPAVIPKAATAAKSRDSGSSGASSGSTSAATAPANPASCKVSTSASSPSSSSSSSGSPATSNTPSPRNLKCSPPSPSSSTSTSAPATAVLPSRHQRRTSDIQLVALDMDGTLLDGKSQIRPSSAAAIRAACSKGVRVILATGKARPAALTAATKFGLEGKDLLVSLRGPGIFLQGLAVHGRDGSQLSDAELPAGVVEAAFRYADETNGRVAAVAFLGDECSTLRMTASLRELHQVYYEPLATVQPSMQALLSGPRVKKVLFMAHPSEVTNELLPHWQGVLASPGSGAALLQAVPDMLEIVPHGVNKWVGAQVLLKSLGVLRQAFMAVGDGGNDLEMVANAGVGVAMGNAVPSVRAAAKFVTASNNEDGIAEAFERFVL